MGSRTSPPRVSHPSWPWPRRLAVVRWVAPTLLALGLAGPACAPDRQALKGEDQERMELESRASSYWMAVRWADAEAASAFVEPADQREQFHLWLQDQLDLQRITDATVVRVDVAERDPAPTQPRADGEPLLTAQVTVRTEGYRVSDQRVRKEDLSQSWYRTEDGWYVQWTP